MGRAGLAMKASAMTPAPHFFDIAGECCCFTRPDVCDPSVDEIAEKGTLKFIELFRWGSGGFYLTGLLLQQVIRGHLF